MTPPAPPDPDTIRAAVRAELARTGMTPYGLWVSLRPGVAKSTLYQWLAGDTSIGSAQASIILGALGIDLTPPPPSHRA